MPSVRLRRHRVVLLFTLFALAISYHFVVVRKEYSIVPDKFLYGLPSSSFSSSSSSSSTLKTTEDAVVAGADHHESVLTAPAPSSTTSSSSSSSTTTTSSSHNSDPLLLTQSPNTKLVSSLETSLFAGTFPVDDYHSGPSSNVLPPGIRQSSSDPSIFSRPRITKFPFANPAALPDEPPLSFAKIQGSFVAESDDERQKREARLAAVKDAFLHSWQGYKKYAWGHDEVQPVSHTFADTFGGLGASIVDALDTLQIMDLTEEFEEAKAFVATLNFTTSNYKTIPIFETTIRFLGGLISAYDLSSPREEIFLDKAVELADLMLGAFDTPNGMPVLYYNPVLAHYGPEEAKLRAGNTVVFAQFSSLSLEFTRLAQITKNNAYYAVIQRISDQMQESQKKTDIPGLWPSFMDISGCVTASEKKASAPSAADNQDVEAAALNRAAVDAETKESDSNAKQKRQVPAALRESLLDVPRPGSATLSPVNLPVEECVGVKAIVGTVKEDSNNKLKYTAGGLADSAYEYMIKEYLLLGGTVGQYKDMYQSATAAIDDNLLFRPKVAGDPDILFSGNVLVDKDTKATEFDAEMTHLTCYIGGMYAIGARALENPVHLQTAEKLTEGCYWSYRATNTGIMPENFHVDPCLSSDCHFVDRFASSEGAGEKKLRKRQVDESAEEAAAAAEAEEDAAEAPVSEGEEAAAKAETEIEGAGENAAAEVADDSDPDGVEKTENEQSEVSEKSESSEQTSESSTSSETEQTSDQGAGENDGEGAEPAESAEAPAENMETTSEETTSGETASEQTTSEQTSESSPSSETEQTSDQGAGESDGEGVEPVESSEASAGKNTENTSEETPSGETTSRETSSEQTSETEQTSDQDAGESDGEGVKPAESSEAPAGENTETTSEGATSGETTSGETTSEETTSGETTSEESTSGEAPSGETTSETTSEESTSETTAEETTSGETTSEQTTSEQTTTGETTSEQTSSEETTSEETKSEEASTEAPDEGAGESDGEGVEPAEAGAVEKAVVSSSEETSGSSESSESSESAGESEKTDEETSASNDTPVESGEQSGETAVSEGERETSESSEQSVSSEQSSEGTTTSSESVKEVEQEATGENPSSAPGEEPADSDDSITTAGINDAAPGDENPDAVPPPHDEDEVKAVEGATSLGTSSSDEAGSESSSTTTVAGTVLEVDAPDAPAEDDPNRWEVGGWYDQPHSILYQDGRYLLRPEALESIFVMYRVTGDRKWQDRGWEMFSAIVKYTKTDAAFSAIKDVTNNRKVTYLDEMESFWMAETLKYAYLLFAEPSLISLDDYVFNTEAHPLLRPSPVQNAPEK